MFTKELERVLIYVKVFAVKIACYEWFSFIVQLDLLLN